MSSINELLRRMPEEGFTEEELDQLIAYFRSQRERWKASGEDGKAVRKKTVKKKKISDDEIDKLLGL